MADLGLPPPRVTLFDMSLTDVETGVTAPAPGKGRRSSSLAVVVSAGNKAFFAAVAGLLLTCSIGVLLWAVTPSSSAGPVSLLRAGVAAFSAGNGMTVTIGRAALTLPPLMITLVAAALLTTVSGRGRVVATGRVQEVGVVVAAVGVYAAAVACSGVVLGPPLAVAAGQWWRPALLALVVVGGTTAVRGDGWRRYLLGRLPAWVPVSMRLGSVGVATLLGGGAVVLAVGLVRSFNDATTVQSLAAPGVGGGLGMALLGIAYLPNAVVAGAGYASGAGFTIGSGTYSPFGSAPTNLPALTLLTAVPHSSVVARSALVVLLVPLLAAVLIGRGAVSRLGRRSDRLLAVVGAAVLAGIALGLLAAVAFGGITGGTWSSMGVPPFLFAAVAAAEVGTVGAAVAVLGRVRTMEIAGRVERADVSGRSRLADHDAPAEVGVVDRGEDGEGRREEELGDEGRAGEDLVVDEGPGDEDLVVVEGPGDEGRVDEGPGDEGRGDEDLVVDEGRGDEGRAGEDRAGGDLIGEEPGEQDEGRDAQPAEALEDEGGADSAAPAAQTPTDGALLPRQERRREEDLIAASEGEADEHLIGKLSRRPVRRQVG